MMWQVPQKVGVDDSCIASKLPTIARPSPRAALKLAMRSPRGVRRPLLSPATHRVRRASGPRPGSRTI